jgi:hypothetical protein
MVVLFSLILLLLSVNSIDNTLPKCIIWYDGCNICNSFGQCTERHCLWIAPAVCNEWNKPCPIRCQLYTKGLFECDEICLNTLTMP